MAKAVKYDIYITADTESNKDGSLYLLSTYNPELGPELFYNLKDFYTYLNTLGNVIVYVHNFANWDSYFLYTNEVMEGYEVYERVNKQKKLLSVTLRHKVGWKNKNKLFNYIKFEDSYPRTMVSVKDYAKSIGEPYNELPSYDDYRMPNEPDKWADRADIELYATKDVVILWKLIETFKGVYGEAFTKTLSAGSMVWREMISQYSSEPKWRHLRFRERFVQLNQHIDSLIRPSFMGGITTPFWNNGIVIGSHNIKSLYPWFKDPVIKGDDISSAYAWAQIKELPFGRYNMLFEESVDQIKRSIKQRNKIVFFAIKYKYTRAKFPLIPKLHMEEVQEYIIEKDGTTLKYNERSQYMDTMLFGGEGIAAVSTLDMRVALENNVYENFEWEIIPFINQTHENPVYGIEFDMKKSPEMYNITMKYYNLKNSAPNKALRTAYKSPLVNLFGKTGERFYETNSELDIVTREYTKEEMLEEAVSPRYSNVAVAAVITSYVHHKLFEKAAEVGFKNMLYCDTDSMFFVQEREEPKQLNIGLGDWDNEVYDPYRVLFICPKKYIIEDENKKRIKSASAGILKSDMTFNIDNWLKGLRHYATRVKSMVSNGVVLLDDVRDVSNSFKEGETYYYSMFNAME